MPATRYYPRSFLKLLLLAFGVVALPMVLVTFSAAYYLDRITGQSHHAVTQAAQAARGSRDLAQEVEALERVVRQFLILGDRGLLGDYDTLRARFKATTSGLSLLPLDESQLRELNRTIEREQQLYDQLKGNVSRPGARARLIEGYVQLFGQARRMLEISNALIDNELELLSRSAERARRTLLWQFGAAIPAGLLLAIGVTFVIARPIRQIDAAVRRLGHGQFTQRVRVRGPADLQYIGERLDWLRRHLGELEQEKERFLRHVSHELKTPLTSLREGAELLADGSMGRMSDAQGEVVAILRDKSVQLQAMIERLLEVQKATDGIAQLDLTRLRLQDVVDRVVADHRFAADARGIAIDARIAAPAIVADAEKLRVILDNLVSNAIKYSPDRGRVTIEAKAAGEDVVIEVGDDGPGIPAADRERVFDWFYQCGVGHGSRVASSGLGLAIVRELVHAHHGRIRVMETAGPGARIAVTLPGNPS